MCVVTVVCYGTMLLMQNNICLSYTEILAADLTQIFSLFSQYGGANAHFVVCYECCVEV